MPDQPAYELAVLTRQETAELLRVHPRTVLRWLHAGKLPGLQVGRDWRISRADVEGMKKRGSKTKAA